MNHIVLCNLLIASQSRHVLDFPFFLNYWYFAKSMWWHGFLLFHGFIRSMDTILWFFFYYNVYFIIYICLVPLIKLIACSLPFQEHRFKPMFPFAMVDQSWVWSKISIRRKWAKSLKWHISRMRQYITFSFYILHYIHKMNAIYEN